MLKDVVLAGVQTAEGRTSRRLHSRQPAVTVADVLAYVIFIVFGAVLVAREPSVVLVLF